MIKLNICEAKTHLSRYLPALARGETILLCKRNQPIAEIRPLKQPSGGGAGCLRRQNRIKILLDTCTFLWLISDAPQLSSTARIRFSDPENEAYLSAVSTWEITLKHGLGKLPLPDSPERFVPEQRANHGITSLVLNEQATFHLHRLPKLHRDPFDRMLICQAIELGLIILTPDPLVTQYPVRTLW